MADPTPEQIEAAAKAIWDTEDSQALDPRWGLMNDSRKRIYRTSARAALIAAAGAAPQEPKNLSIMNGWLVESVGKHTCGAGMDGYGHEPGCGYEPVLNLAELDGHPAQVDEAKLAEVRMIRDAVDRWEVDGDDERLVNEVLDPWISKHLRGGGQ